MRVEIREKVRSTVHEDGGILLDLEQGKYFSLNGMGAEIWKKLQSGAALSEIQDHLQATYAAPPDRIEGTVCAELSGGLDSSSIVCVADEILRAGEAEAGAIETISYVFDRATRSDERPGIHLREEDHPILAPLPEDARLEYPTYEHAFAARHEHVERTLRSLTDGWTGASCGSISNARDTARRSITGQNPFSRIMAPFHRRFITGLPGPWKGGECMKPYETPEIFELGAVESLTFGIAIDGPDDDETGWKHWS